MNSPWIKRLLSLLLVAVLFVTFSDGENVFAERATVNVTLNTYFDSENIVPTNGLSGLYGNTLSFENDVATQSGYSFAYWIVNGAVEKSYPIDHQFVLTIGIDLVAVFSPDDEYVGVFRDSNLQMLSIKYANTANSFTLDDTDITLPDKPGYAIDNPKWSSGLTLSANTVLTLQYAENSTDFFSITLNDVAVNLYDGVPVAFDSIGVAMPDADAPGRYFEHWEVGGEVVSYDTSYHFTVLEDKVITAIYDDTEAQAIVPVVSLSSDLFLRSGYYSFLGQMYIPVGYTLVEFGMLTTGNPSHTPTFGDGVSTVAKGSSYLAESKEYVMSFSSDFARIRSYMVLDNGVDEPISYYSAVYDVPHELIISEYIEGSSNNKAIEIYNLTGGTIALDAYSVAIYSNGSPTASNTLELDDITLDAGETYVIYNSSASEDIKDFGDVSSIVTNFNGDDAIALLRNGVVIDQFGVIGEDLGSSWPVGTDSTVDHTLIRNASVTYPSSTWNTDEWTVYDQDTFGYLSLHYITGSTDLGAHPFIRGTANASITQGDDYLPLSGVTAEDIEDTDPAPDVTYTVYDSNETLVPSPVDFTSLDVGTYSIVYSTTDSDGNTITKTITLTISAPVTAPDLFISEYVEGGGYNKVIEIYNPTDSAVDLTGYVLRYYSAGGSTYTELDLSTLSVTSIDSGDVLVLANNNVAITDTNILTQADVQTSFINHNGDDCYELVKDGVVIDSLGTWGDVNWGVDKTLVRNASISNGNTTYTLAEWTQYAKDTTSYIGTHTSDYPGT